MTVLGTLSFTTKDQNRYKKQNKIVISWECLRHSFVVLWEYSRVISDHGEIWLPFKEGNSAHNINCSISWDQHWIVTSFSRERISRRSLEKPTYVTATWTRICQRTVPPSQPWVHFGELLVSIHFIAPLGLSLFYALSTKSHLDSPLS